MAVKNLANPSGEKIERADTYRVAPDDIKLGRNSRGEKPTDDDVQRLAVLIAQSPKGQEVPCLGHKDTESGQVVLDDGFTRYYAVQLLRQGFDYHDPLDDKTRTYHVPDLKLWIDIDTNIKNDKDAFLKSIRGNLRNDVTDVQEAYAQNVLRDEYGYVNAEIAREYGYTNQNRIDKLEKLINMPQGVIDLVREGKLAMSVAVENLYDVAAETRDLIISKATDDNGKVQGARVRELLRSVLSGDTTVLDVAEYEKPAAGKKRTTAVDPDESETPAAAGSIKRTVKNVLTFLDYYAGLIEGEGSEAGKEVCRVFARWVRGDLKTDVKLEKVLDGLK